MKPAPLATSRSARVFVLLWLALSFAAASIYILVLPPLTSLLGLNDQPARLQEQPWAALKMIAIGPAGFGAMVGLGQYLLLRKHLDRAGWWVPATMGGYCFLFALPGLGGFSGDLGWMSAVALFAEVGTGMGALQWLVLRGRLARAGWWILFSLGGWLAALVLTTAAYAANLYVEPLDMLSAFFLPILAGGLGMSWLLQQSTAQAPKTRAAGTPSAA